MDYEAIIKSAVAQKASLLEQVELLESLISSAVALMQASSGVTVVDVRSTTRATAQDDRKSKPVARAGSIMGPTREATSAALRSAGKPLKTAALLQRILAAGVPVGGKNEVATLSARLSNSLEFTNHRDVGWWFSDEPVPAYTSIFDEAGAKLALESPASNLTKGESYEAAPMTPS